MLDSSALVTLLIDPGGCGERVAEVLAGADVHAPDLLPYEVANVLRRHRTSGRLTPTEATLAHQDLQRLRIELWPYEVLGERSWALTGSLSSYDAAYLALAERLGATLVTADARLARGSGYEPVVLV